MVKKYRPNQVEQNATYRKGQHDLLIFFCLVLSIDERSNDVIYAMKDRRMT